MLVNVIAPIVIAVVPLFVTVTALLALVVFTSWLPKLTGAPVSEIALPRPVRLTVLVWLKKPLLLMVTLPLRVPEAGRHKVHVHRASGAVGQARRAIVRFAVVRAGRDVADGDRTEGAHTERLRSAGRPDAGQPKSQVADAGAERRERRDAAHPAVVVIRHQNVARRIESDSSRFVQRCGGGEDSISVVAAAPVPAIVVMIPFGLTQRTGCCSRR